MAGEDQRAYALGQGTQRVSRAAHQAAQQGTREPTAQRAEQVFLLAVKRQVPCELIDGDGGQDAGAERTLFDWLRRLGRRVHLVPRAAMRASIRVPHVLDDVGLRRLQLELPRDVLADHHAPLVAGRAILLGRQERMLNAPPWQSFGEHEAAPVRTTALGGLGLFVRLGFFGSRARAFAQVEFTRKQQLLVGTGQITLAPPTEQRTLQERDLLLLTLELLVVCGARHLLLRTNRALLGNRRLLLR